MFGYIAVVSILGLIANVKIRKYFFGVAIGFAILGFFFLPRSYDDLSLAFTHLENLKTIGWTYYDQINAQTSYFHQLPTLMIYYYFLSFLPSVHFLPAISMFIVYFCSFSLIANYAEKSGMSKHNAIILMIIVILCIDYYGAVSGIRNTLAFVVCAYFLYEDLYCRRNRLLCFIMYLLMFGLHSSVIFVLFVRVLVAISTKWVVILLFILSIIWMNFLPSIFNILGSIGVPSANNLAWKLEIYSEYATSNINLIAGVYYTRLMYVRGLFSVILVVTQLLRAKRNGIDTLDSFDYAYLYIMGLMLGSFSSFNIYLRLSNLMIFVGIIVLGRYFSYKVRYRLKRIVLFRISLFSYQVPVMAVSILMFYFIMINSYYGISFGI